MRITIVQIHFIITVFSVLIGALYAASGGGVVAGNRQTEGRTVTEIDRLLH